MVDIDEHAMTCKEEFAVYPEAGQKSDKELMYLALGLVGESGEVAEKAKKAFRDGSFDPDLFAKELGDVYWYLGQLSLFVNKNPSEILQINHDKLMSRKQRDVLKGNGDER